MNKLIEILPDDVELIIDIKDGHTVTLSVYGDYKEAIHKTTLDSLRTATGDRAADIVKELLAEIGAE